MQKLLILGGGTAGTMVANKLRRRLPTEQWAITLVDRDDSHHYQPGYLFIPFGVYTRDQVVRSRHTFLPDGVDFVVADVDVIDPAAHQVRLESGRVLDYDQLVIATGCVPRPDQTTGMAEGEWRKSVFDFYTLDGALALHDALERFTGGRLVVHITELPYKCPVAPLEFAFLADEYFTKRGIRDKVEIVYVTPLEGAFTKKTCAQALGYLLDDRGIIMEPDFATERVDNETKTLVSYDEREVPFDLLVTVPINMGQDFIDRSGLGDDLFYVPVDKHTMLATGHDDIFALGDASNIPTSKAGSVAHFAVDVFEHNFLEHIAGRPMTRSFDGHANCFIESGFGKALLIDFNYDVEPLKGTYPLAKVGPMHLLTESRLNHLGKLAFRHLYWTMLLPGRRLPVPTLMSMAGKDPSSASTRSPSSAPTVPTF